MSNYKRTPPKAAGITTIPKDEPNKTWSFKLLGDSWEVIDRYQKKIEKEQGLKISKNVAINSLLVGRLRIAKHTREGDGRWGGLKD